MEWLKNQRKLSRISCTLSVFDELVRGGCFECGLAPTLSLFECFAATTHRQRSQNVRNQFGGFRALRSKSMEESVVVEQVSEVVETKVVEEAPMKKIKRKEKVSLLHPNCDVT